MRRYIELLEHALTQELPEGVLESVMTVVVVARLVDLDEGVTLEDLDDLEAARRALIRAAGGGFDTSWSPFQSAVQYTAGNVITLIRAELEGNEHDAARARRLIEETWSWKEEDDEV